jgi:glycosyltransferase involved in cell wall biosynthesis
MSKIRVVFFHRKPRLQNFSVEILFGEIRKFFSDQIYPVVHVAKYESNGIWKRLYIGIEAWLAQDKGDINHVTGDINFVGLFLARKRTVLTILDLGFMYHPQPFYRFILKWLWLTIPVKRAAVVTTISEAVRDEILKHTNCQPEKIKVVYVPVSSSFDQSPKTFNHDKPRILQVGTKANKNIARLVVALKGIPCHLDIIGENPSAEILSLLREHEISYSVSQRLSEEQMIQKYHDCDLVTLVSTYEGFGMPIVEANKVGRAVITSHVMSMPEVAGNAAHLVDPFQVDDIRLGILKVIKDDAYREQLIQNGFENQKRFDGSKIAAQLEEIYKEVLASH